MALFLCLPFSGTTHFESTTTPEPEICEEVMSWRSAAASNRRGVTRPDSHEAGGQTEVPHR